MYFKDCSKYISGANLKLPFATFTFLISPAKLYISSNKNLCIFAKQLKLPISLSFIILFSNNFIDLALLIFSSCLASSA